MLLLLGLSTVSLSTVSSGQNAPATNTPDSATASTKISQPIDQPTTRDIKKAEKLFQHALRLHSSGQLSEALDTLETSRELNPAEPVYSTTEEFVRQQMVTKHLESGNQLLQEHHKIEAMAEFREALGLDPSSALAEQMLRESSGLDRPQPSVALQPLTFAPEAQLDPKPGRQKFSFRGNSRDLLQLVARSFGLTIAFDDSMVNRNVRFDIEDVDFWAALAAARRLTHTFVVPLSATEMLIANDTQDVRRRLERMSLRTFYYPEASSPQDLQEVVTLIRTLFDVRFVITNPGSSTVTVRAPARVLDAVEQLIDDLSAGRPQVMLEVQAIQVDESMSRQIGIGLPLQFKLFNINTELRNATSGANQALINQFLATGNINPADVVALLALLATQQQQQQSGTQSPLLQPFTTFGGGQTRTGIGLPPLSAHFQFNRSLFSSLQKTTIRAEQGHAANFHVGDRFPVPTSSFAPLLNIPSLPAALQSRVNNLQPIIPSYSYEDLGITLKMTPNVNAASEVILQLEINLKLLGATSFNNIPTISNREYKGTISTRDGQTSVIAGSISGSEVNTISGVPGISKVPVIGLATGVRNKQMSTNQLLLLITPHVVRAQRQPGSATETYMDGGN